MNNGIRIRRLSVSDLPNVVEILQSAFPDLYELKGLDRSEIGRILYLRFKYEKLINRIKQCAINSSLRFLFTSAYDRVGFVAEEGSESKVVGVAIVSHIIGDLWNLDQIAVFPGYRRRGIGTELMKKVISHVKTMGGKKMQLLVAIRSVDAITLYTKLGFTVTNKLNHLIFDLT